MRGRWTRPTFFHFMFPVAWGASTVCRGPEATLHLKGAVPSSQLWAHLQPREQQLTGLTVATPSEKWSAAGAGVSLLGLGSPGASGLPDSVPAPLGPPRGL